MMSENEEHIELGGPKYPLPPGLASITVIRADDPKTVFVLVFNSAARPSSIKYVPNKTNFPDGPNIPFIEVVNTSNIWRSPPLKDKQIGCGADSNNDLELYYNNSPTPRYRIKCKIPNDHSIFIGDGRSYNGYTKKVCIEGGGE